MKYIPGVKRGCAIGCRPEWLRGAPRMMADSVSYACALHVVKRRPWWRF